MGASDWRGKLVFCLGSFFFFLSLMFGHDKRNCSNDYVKRVMCQLPYSILTPLQAAVGVVQKVFIFSILTEKQP